MNATGRPTALDAAKSEALRTRGTLNPHPERISAPLFRASVFFDARDLVQVKYEMLRQVCREGVSVQTAARTHGFSRVAWYQVQARYDAQGLPGLLPQPRGPRRPPKKRNRLWPRAKPRRCASSTSC